MNARCRPQANLTDAVFAQTVLMGTCAVECLACEKWFHQECSDTSEVNIIATDGLPSVHWYCRDVLLSLRNR